MVERPYRRTRLPHTPALTAALLTALLLAALALAAAWAAAPASAATSEDYFFVSSIGPTYAPGLSFSTGGAGPNGIATDADGNVYVTRPWGFAKFNADGEHVCTYTGDNGYVPGVSYGLDLDRYGNVYYADSENHWIVMLKPNADGTSYSRFSMTGKMGGGSDADIGTGPGEFDFPSDVAVGGGHLYVADMKNNRVQEFAINVSSGVLTWMASWGKTGEASGSGDGEFNWPRGIDAGSGSAPHVFVADEGNRRIQEFTSDGTFIGKFGSTSSTDPLYLSSPTGVSVDIDGDVYVTDNGADCVRKFREKDGSWTRVTQFGSNGTGDSQFYFPWASAVDPDGYLYVTDTFNNKIKKFARDLTPPTVTPLRFPTGWVKSFDWCELEASDPAVTGEYASGVAGLYYSKTGGAPWTEYLEPFVGLDFVQGDNTVTYYAVDKVGNSSTPTAVHLLWDKTVPVTTATGVPDGWARAVSVTLTPSADGFSPITSTQYRAQGAATWTTYAAPFSVTTEGASQWEFRSTDEAGNVETPKTVTVHLDATPPTTSIVDLPTGWTRDVSHVRLEGTDALSGVATTEWSTDDGATWSTQDLAQGLPQGTYTISFRSTDKAGNVEPARSAAVSYDKTPPTPRVIAARSVKRGKTVKLPYRITDVAGAKAKVSIRIYKGGRLKARIAAGARAANTSLTLSYRCKLARGSYTWKVYATDLAGNAQVKPASGKLTVK